MKTVTIEDNKLLEAANEFTDFILVNPLEELATEIERANFEEHDM